MNKHGKHLLRGAAAILILALGVLAPGFSAAAEKLRVVVLTDISNEPDDQQSLVRFLTYANEFDVEGLIATTSCWRRNNPDLPTILQVLDAYEKVEANLGVHAPGYPTANHLRSVSKAGVDGYGMNAAAEQLDNAAIAHIISVLDKDDPRPVWFCAWGGGNTLGGAVMRLQKERPDDVARLVKKIRGYEIALQDDGWAYIARQFPDAKLISSRLAWKGISRTTTTFNAWSESWGGNNTVFTAEWVAKNIQRHGPLGEQYPDAIYLWEGDTPSFLYLLPHGLSDPEQVHFGGWGGRFEPQRKQNVRSGTGNNTVDGLLDEHRDYGLYSDAHDAWSYEGTDYQNEYCAIFRWREDFQNDFAARMLWSVTDAFEKANHNPIAVLNGDETREIIALTARVGDTVTLTSAGSHDLDGDTIVHHWMIYPEPGTFVGDLSLSASTGEETRLTIPEPGPGSPDHSTIHVILTVRDDGAPPMVAYRRAIITVHP